MPFTEFNNKKIFYRLAGKGSPVILVHGFAEDGRVWNSQIEAIKDSHLVVIPDLPGSGSSEMLDGKASIEQYAEVIKALADLVIGKNGNRSDNRFSLIGHSMGGYITLAFAEKYPELLKSFGLFHSSGYADSEEKAATRKKAIEFISRNGTEAFLKTSVPNLFAEPAKKEKPELIAQLMDIASAISPEVLIQYYEAMLARPDRTEVLKTFTNPVLIIAGKFDAAVPLPASLEQFCMPTVAMVHILQHSGHMGMWEEPNLSNLFLSDFLRASG